MRRTIVGLAVGVCTMLAAMASPTWAQEVDVTLANVGTPGETGAGSAEVNLANGRVNIEMTGLKPAGHENALGLRVRGYAAWLVNSEDALSKLNLGFFTPDADGSAKVRFRSLNKNASLTGLGFNQVVITDEIELDTTRSQPSGPPVAAGNIPGTTAPTTLAPAFEVIMGDPLDDVFGFQPKQVLILSGQAVRWTNASPKNILPHTVTRTEAVDGAVPSPGEEFDSGPVATSSSFTRTFTLPEEALFGLWNYHCTPHLGLGMTGRILVVRPPAS